ncbi:MAG: hypothetical protein IMZ43_10550 [Thermoplasmata archaeon]|nr:hypothetical protein [Thermoplasmata archaeon]
MGKNTLKRSLIVGIVFLFLSTTCIPVLASEGKPDLIIEDIVTEPVLPEEDKYLCRVKNIGTETVMETIDVDVTVKRLFLGIFPIRTVRFYHVGGNYGNGLYPGETIDILIAYESYLPVYGIYRYNCVVNPDHHIDESEYGNNVFSKTYNAFFGYP